jgi:uncharacterized repeat protein (TIGR01451 family)
VADGTAAGTIIENTASVDFDMGGTSFSLDTNTTSFAVAERIEVIVTLANSQLVVSANDMNQALLFTVTNTGNGTESFNLSMDSVISGDDFDPIPAVPGIYFDTDGSGDFNTGDVAYDPGVNDPNLAADASVDVLVINHIPSDVTNGQIGRSELTATSNTGTGVPGTVYANSGDNNVDAIIGNGEGDDVDTGEYFVENIVVSVQKSQLVVDPSGGNEPVQGATLTYTITVEVASAGVATASAIRDAIPPYSTYVPNSILLNGALISDATDGDAGEYDTSVTPSVVVRLGDLIQGDGPQTVVFQVTID